MKFFFAQARRAFCIVMWMAITFNAVAVNISIPKGWRPPNEAELSDSWRSNAPDKYSIAVGDFDGDGQPDWAMLLISDRRHSFALFIYSADVNHRYAWHKIDEVFDEHRIHGIGIEVVPPGKYATACGKAYVACKGASSKEIESSNPIINYFKTESANRYVYFDKRSRTFRKVWMSD